MAFDRLAHCRRSERVKPLEVLRAWTQIARKTRLSGFVTVLFSAALILPWFAFAWLAQTERAEQLQKADGNLAALAAAYGEHAAALIRLGVAVPVDGAPPARNIPESLKRGEEEMAAFRRALDLPGVQFSLRSTAAPRRGAAD